MDDDDEHSWEHDEPDEEPDDIPEGMMPMIPMPPSGFMKMIARQQDQAEMAGEVFRHEVRDLFHALSPEHLAVLGRMIDYMSNDSAGVMANFWHGQVTALLDFKHNVCTGCGKNHDAELLATAKNEEPTE